MNGSLETKPSLLQPICDYFPIPSNALKSGLFEVCFTPPHCWSNSRIEKSEVATDTSHYLGDAEEATCSLASAEAQSRKHCGK
jgi:hypothetical protein